MSKSRLVLVSLCVAVVLALGVGAAVLTSTWNKVDRVDIDRDITTDARGVIDPSGSSGATDTEVPDPVFRNGTEVILLVGSDARDDLDDLTGFGSFTGRRADVVMVLIRSEGGAALLSLPRDLLIDDPCTGGSNRINALLEGCGDVANGPTLLSLGVSELIGRDVDHFAMVDLAGFQEAVDAIGGYEICVENAVRDAKSQLELPAGCTMADGTQTLAWLRSRSTQELTAEGWRVVPGVSDLARNDRQRAFLIDMMGRLSDFTSPQAMSVTARTVAPFVTVDTDLGLGDAVEIAWTMRGLATGSLVELTVPVRFHTTDQGASVLLPSVSVSEIVSGYLSTITAGGSVVGASG